MLEGRQKILKIQKLVTWKAIHFVWKNNITYVRLCVCDWVLSITWRYWKPQSRAFKNIEERTQPTTTTSMAHSTRRNKNVRRTLCQTCHKFILGHCQPPPIFIFLPSRWMNEMSKYILYLMMDVLVLKNSRIFYWSLVNSIEFQFYLHAPNCSILLRSQLYCTSTNEHFVANGTEL